MEATSAAKRKKDKPAPQILLSKTRKECTGIGRSKKSHLTLLVTLSPVSIIVSTDRLPSAFERSCTRFEGTKKWCGSHTSRHVITCLPDRELDLSRTWLRTDGEETPGLS